MNMTSIVTVTEYNNDSCEVIDVNTTDSNNYKKLLQLSNQSINSREVDTRDDEVDSPMPPEATTQSVDSFGCCDERESIEITLHELKDNGVTTEDSDEEEEEEEEQKEQPTSLLQQQISLKKSVSRSFKKLSNSLSSKATESEEVVQQIVRTSSSGLKNVWQNLSVSKSASMKQQEDEDATTMMIPTSDGLEVEINKPDEYDNEKKDLPTIVEGSEDEVAESATNSNNEGEKEKKFTVVPPNNDNHQSSNKSADNNNVLVDDDFSISDAMTDFPNEISTSLQSIISDITSKVEEEKPTVLDNISKASRAIKTSFSSMKKSLVSGFFGGNKRDDLYKGEQLVKTKDEVVTDALNDAYETFRQVSNKW